MKTSAVSAMIVVLLLFGSFPAEANFFKNLAAISIIRERSTEFGIDIKGYSNGDILDFLRTIPSREMAEFQESYARRPDSGTTMNEALEAINRVEFEREKSLLDKWIGTWEKSRSENRPVDESRQQPRDSFAFNN